MNKIVDVLNVIDSCIGGAQWFVFLLLGTGLFFTLYLKFPQIRYFGHAVNILRGKYDHSHYQGDTSHFQALTTALSGTVGTGNIAGVALALHLGGPAALFWMLVTAFLGMTTKMVEVTLSHKYRERTLKGDISGGPMYYMRNRLNMRWLAAIFAVATIFSSFGTGSLPQVNSISNSMFATFGIKHYVTGAVLAVVLGLIIIGGIKRIAKVSEKLVPFMAIIYILGALSVLVVNCRNIIPSFISIFSNVFSGTAATGGFLGAGFILAFNRGVNRGLFSNEAGQGSAPIAHAAAKASEPVSEGMVAILEPFLDTIIICFMTGMVLLSSGVWSRKFDNRFQQTDVVVLADKYYQTDEYQCQSVAGYLAGTNTIPLYNGVLRVVDGRIDESRVTILHARSFADDVVVKYKGKPYTGNLVVGNGSVNLSMQTGESLQMYGKSLIHSAPLSTEAFKYGLLGDLGKYIIPFALLLFAFTTSVAWSYYGDRAVIYLWGEKWVRPYHVIYVVGFFLASFTDTSVIWAVSGVTIAFMTLPNLIGLLLLRKEMKSLLDDYDKNILKNESDSGDSAV